MNFMAIRKNDLVLILYIPQTPRHVYIDTFPPE